MLIVAIAFILLLIFGLPIAFVIGVTGILHLSLIPNSNLFEVITQRLFSGINDFSLLAIPFFVLAGELMNASGITSRLLALSKNLVGHLRGGLAYVNVLIGLFLGAILGSANAEAAIRSSVVVPEMEKQGFPRKFAAALTATSSVLGPIHPPSIVFIIYAVMTSSSVGAMFLAGIIPAFLIALAHMVVIYFFARKMDLEIHPFPSLKKLFMSIVESLPALSIPLIILGGIYSGMFTPTEAGAVACFVAFVVGVFFYKELKLSQLPRIFFNTGLITSSVTIIISAASIIGWTLTIEQLPQKTAEFLLSLSDNTYVILLLINIFLLIVGMFMEVTAALIILVPVLFPVVTALGIDPIHFGLIVCLNLCIGFVTPPVGVVLYVTSNITKVDVPEIVKSALPFLAALIVVLIIVTFVPAVSLWLPRALGF